MLDRARDAESKLEILLILFVCVMINVIAIKIKSLYSNILLRN